MIGIQSTIERREHKRDAAVILHSFCVQRALIDRGNALTNSYSNSVKRLAPRENNKFFSQIFSKSGDFRSHGDGNSTFICAWPYWRKQIKIALEDRPVLLASGNSLNEETQRVQVHRLKLAILLNFCLSALNYPGSRKIRQKSTSKMGSVLLTLENWLNKESRSCYLTGTL